jgi:hypothetical protein
MVADAITSVVQALRSWPSSQAACLRAFRTAAGDFFRATSLWREIHFSFFSSYGWIPHNASFGFLDLTPSILLLRQFWD